MSTTAGRRIIRSLHCLLNAALLSMLAACAGAPTLVAPAGLFHDELFAAPDEPVTTDGVFTVTDAMRRFLDVDIAHQLRTKGLQTGLAEALYTRNQLRLEYDTTHTKHVLAFDAVNTRSLANLAEALQRQGRSGEARAAREQLVAIEAHPPSRR